MKEKYFDVEAEIIFFETSDVITKSEDWIHEGDDDNDVMGDDPYGDF